MSVKSLKRHEGWIEIDHRASPGIPRDVALKIGIDPNMVAEGKYFEGATLTCSHCKTSYNKNPYRIRAREYCKKCDHYICDECGRDAARPDYVHRSGAEVLDAVLEARHRGTAADLSAQKISIIVP